jgi:hypothetical protein
MEEKEIRVKTCAEVVAWFSGQIILGYGFPATFAQVFPRIRRASVCIYRT